MSPEKNTKLRLAPRAFMEQLVHIGNTPLVLTDLSLSGIRLKGLSKENPLKSQDVVQLKWRILPQLKEMSVQVQCVWRKENEVGLILKNLDAKTKYLIRALVRYHRNLEA